MFNKIQISFHDKNSQQIGHRRNILIQAIYDKPTANIICMNERLKDFPVRSGAKQGCPLSPLLFSIVLKVPTAAVKEEKQIKGIHIGKEEVKLFLFMMIPSYIILKKRKS